MGNQRLKTTDPEDLNQNEEEKVEKEEEKVVNEEEKDGRIQIFEDRQPLNNKTVQFAKSDAETENGHKFYNLNFFANSKETTSTVSFFSHSSYEKFVLSPISNFSIVWNYLLCFFVCYDLVRVPFDICFSPAFSIEILVIDLIRIGVYFLDILIQFNCAFKYK